jgi:hypothetical protein
MDYYARFSQKGKPFVALTGLTHKEFKRLLPGFRTCFLKRMKHYTLKGKKRGGGQRRRRYVEYSNSPLLTIEDKLMFILVYLRKGTTQDIFGAVFHMSQPVANKWIHILHPCLNQALADLGERPARSVAELHLSPKGGQVFFQDGTERPIERPKDPDLQRLYYSGKKKKHCIKNNVLIDLRPKILLLTPTCEGKKHDKKVADDIGLVLPAGSSLYQDLGFLGYSVLNVTMIQPIKKPRGKELTPEQKEINRQISSVRVRVEHAIGGVKRFRIVKDQVRARKDNFRDRVMETCCGLHNFRLNFRPWHYKSDFDKV